MFMCRALHNTLHLWLMSAWLTHVEPCPEDVHYIIVFVIGMIITHDASKDSLLSMQHLLRFEVSHYDTGIAKLRR